MIADYTPAGTPVIELDESDPDVSELAGLLWLGQNGCRAAA